jgi:drug/metabolite transporter (DMT)-like permease
MAARRVLGLLVGFAGVALLVAGDGEDVGACPVAEL